MSHLFVLSLFLCLFSLTWTEDTEEDSEKLSDSDLGSDDLGSALVGKLRNDANLDLPFDAEYEDLRAELLAYHSALATLTSRVLPPSRRSMITTPCWDLGGVCINYKLCEYPGFYLSEVPGCKDKLRVCCFIWNKYNVRDMKDHGIGNLQMPWSIHTEFGGQGIKVKPEQLLDKPKKKKMKKKLRTGEVNLLLV